ncbi:DUF4235 domain-containing protein [Sporichthya polymorpha]|uniref:DUF4235 domain-containing protein n=1 Tax=Sporichthya polymorpha TaxID=35751 RepID=UPI00036268FF|nr:DUF4235 domain-containing protein [Sporichthya polymorpha]
MKLLYKPLAIVLGIAAGSIAGKIVTKVWTKVDDNDVPPDPDLKEASWALVLAGAALQGVVYSVVKAAVKRGGAQGMEKVTGTWPGKTADDLETAAA